MNSAPLVSVLMTSYNREKYISEAIDSVLCSSYRNFELIIVDDGSKDRTMEIVRQYADKDQRVKVYRNEKNLGDYPNRNKAASYAKGKYIKYLDADDIIYYYGLEIIINYMERFPDAGFGLASFASDEKPFPILLSPKEAYIENFQIYSHFDRAPGSSIINLEAFNKVGGFSGKRMVGDYEFWFKIARYYNMVKYPYDFYWSRSHGEQESKSSYAQNYPKLKKQIREDALNHVDCPLNEEELKYVRKLIKKYEAKNNVLSALTKIKATLKYQKP
ncbi:MAG TPA: glycosyltransferase family 2 protein [Puia sp.]|jgi:glycosyltransferase involved in cell wall biosynthesis|nr:glycosyltransferase family 2 protein [Puia sp.]